MAMYGLKAHTLYYMGEMNEIDTTAAIIMQDSSYKEIKNYGRA